MMTSNYFIVKTEKGTITKQFLTNAPLGVCIEFLSQEFKECRIFDQSKARAICCLANEFQKQFGLFKVYEVQQKEL